MRVAVVGAGFTGLASAIELVDKGVEVDIYEKEKYVGGLAGGLKPLKDKKNNEWNWSLEFFYHHIFTNDIDIIDISKKVGLPPFFLNPKTSSLLNGKIEQLDSPISVLTFSGLTIFGRIRMGIGLAILKIIPNGLFLEKYTAEEFLPKLIGNEGYKKIWEKLLTAKFGSKKNIVNMAWFWSRVAKRTKSLGYFEGGFETLATKMKEYVEKKGGKFFLEREFNSQDSKKYGKVILTVPAPIANKITGEKTLPAIDYLWAQTLVLEMNKSLMNNYWLNILEKNWPFLVVVEHTKLVSKKKYGDKTIIYLGNYLEPDNPQLKLSKETVLKLYEDFLIKINPNFKSSWITRSFLFRAPYAQPVFPTNYSLNLNRSKKIVGKYLLANMSMVYPFDRGTNYAVKLGIETAKLCLQ